jgi:hypothetical protein
MGYAGKVLKGNARDRDLAAVGRGGGCDQSGDPGCASAMAASKTTEYFYAESTPPFGDDSAFARDGTRPPDEVRNQIF